MRDMDPHFDDFIKVIQATMPELEAWHKRNRASHERSFGTHEHQESIHASVRIAIGHFKTIIHWLKSISAPPLIVEHMTELEQQNLEQAKIIRRAFDSWM